MVFVQRNFFNHLFKKNWTELKKYKHDSNQKYIIGKQYVARVKVAPSQILN